MNDSLIAVIDSLRMQIEGKHAVVVAMACSLCFIALMLIVVLYKITHRKWKNPDGYPWYIE
jgi:hypothetical protein